MDETRMRAAYEKMKGLDTIEISDDDQDDLRIALLEEFDTIEDWNEILDRELGKFAKGEEYDFVKDMRKQFAPGLASTEA